MTQEEKHSDQPGGEARWKAKNGMVEQRLAGALKGLSAPQHIPRRQDTGPAPLSFAQQRLWFMDRLQPGKATYNIPKLVRLRGTLDGRVLERILDEIVRRHESLRTTFTMHGEEPLQEIAPSVVMELPLVDLRTTPQGLRETEALHLAGEEACRPFNLESGPLFRALLIRLDERDHMLLLSMHHIISDGWSMGVLFREFSELYKAFTAGRPSPLPELPIQYADYAVWQQQSLVNEALAKQREYWKTKLSGELTPLGLPTDRPRPAVQSFNGSSYKFVVRKETAEALKRIGRGEGATLFMMLVAAFNVLLHRYSGASDIVFGTPFAGRTRGEMEPLIGFFVSTIVLRTDLSGDPTFPELLRRVRTTALEAFSHQDFPFEKIVEELRPDRDPSHAPVFQLMFAVQSDTDQNLVIPGLEMSFQDVDTNTAKFDMTISLTDTPRGLVCYWEYNSDLFDAKRIERMGAHFRLILESIAADPAKRLWQFPLLEPGERETILVKWNDTGAEFPADRSVAEVFEQQAEKTPDAVALLLDGTSVSYRELNARADVLAGQLLALGVAPGRVVGICMERSVEMIVGLLGIVKAGAAYLPLDDDLPAERLEGMVADCAVDIIVVQEHLRGHIPGFRGREVVPDTAPADHHHAALNPRPRVRADDLFYVMYTSGSTGKPKGVEIVQQGVLRLVRGINYGHLGSDETMFLFAPLSFDASTFEIWGCLLNGGKLVIFPGRKASIAELGAVIAASGVTTLWLTTSLFEQVVSESLESLRGVRQMLTGGDVLSVEHVKRYLRRFPESRLINCYGPTENTTFTTSYPMLGEEEFVPSVPIGRPVSNTEVYVLDEKMEAVPVGVVGELYIGGKGLARGYHGRPDLTAERFVPDPFRGGGGRLYRSGDMVRYLEDGRIEFLGRRDHQVKLRGYRIELGEIEAVLRSHEAVSEAVVVVRHDRAGDKRLVGYCVGKQLEGGALRSYLRRKMPDYMVPSRIVILERMPLTSSGKVDRRNLPAPAEERTGAKQGPRTAAEKVVAKIWKEVLGLEEVGVEENFFELGGHSLLATRVLSRLLGTTGAEIPLMSFFEAPTVEGLALLLEEKLLDQVERMPDDGPGSDDTKT